MKKRIFFCLVLLLFCSCKSKNSNKFEYSVPPSLDDGLVTGHLNEVGIDENRIINLGDAILTGKYSGVDSVLILSGDKLVFEAYFGNWEINSIHDIMSCTKSIVSATFGIAKDQGFINSEQDRLFSFLTEYSHLQNQFNQDIRLFHLLTMTAGFDWNQSPPFDNNNSLMQMTNADDAIEYILGRKMVEIPGEKWIYNGGCTQLLAEVINTTTGAEANDYAHSQLFEPLGITHYEWKGMNDGRANADYGLHMRSRDMAKIGLLYLNTGIWQGKRILSETWIKESSKAHVKSYGDSNQTGYGFQWWVNPFYGQGCQVEHYSALGNGGQCIIVFPTLDMVVVFTQHYYNRNDDAYSMVNNYIVPAILYQHKREAGIF